MILRRLMERAKNGQWGIVAIDFFIVVFGVFLGIQLGNWNGARADRDSYEQAMSRLEAEINTNLETIDQLDSEIQPRLDDGRAAFDILQSCEHSVENLKSVNNALRLISGTYGLALQTNALNELTTSDALLEQQTPAIRKGLGELKYYRDLVLREAEFAETEPLRQPVHENPIIGFAEPYEREITYVGVDFSRTYRPLILKVPLDEACKNDQLIASFYVWERWQNTLPGLTRIIRAKLEASKKDLGF